MPGEQTPQPIRPSERIAELDILRGFAMLGVLLAYCLWSLGTAPPETYNPLDRALDAVLGFLVDGKMYTILAFLFGLGFSIQLGRARDDATATRVFMRRLAALAVIGLAHALLLRNGDILLPYALTGFLLIPFRRSGRGTIVAAAAIALMAPYLVQFLWERSGLPLPQRPDLAGAPYLVENAAWVRYWFATAPFNWPHNLALFLLGFLAGREQLLSRIGRDRGKLGIIVGAGVVAGALFYVLRLHFLSIEGNWPPRQILVGLSYSFHCWGLSSAYVAALLLAMRPGSARASNPFAAIGRLALSNYLLQAILIVPLCLAFGWFDRFTPTTALFLALGVFGLQLLFSLFWLRHYQYGPAEWFWRLMTYGRAPVLKSSNDYAPV